MGEHYVRSAVGRSRLVSERVRPVKENYSGIIVLMK
jgi:hypothetical protein